MTGKIVNVWVVTDCWKAYERLQPGELRSGLRQGDDILGVFETEQKAEAFRKETFAGISSVIVAPRDAFQWENGRVSFFTVAGPFEMDAPIERYY